MKWIIAFIFGVALIAVYKTFDNINNVLTFIGNVFSALKPFIIGFIIAYVLNMPCKKLEALYKKIKYKPLAKKSKTLSIATVYIVFLAIIVFAVKSIIPNLYNNVIDFYNNILPFTQNAINTIEEIQTRFGFEFVEINEDTARLAIQNILNSINPVEFGKYAQGALSFTTGLLDVFIALIVSIYMLIERERLVNGAKRVFSIVLSKEKNEKMLKYSARVNEIFSNYVYSCVLDALVVAILATLILSVIGVKYALIFGTVIGVCNLIPYFGAIVSNIFTVVITVFTGGIMKAVWVAVSLFVLGQVDGNIIGPRIMGSKLDVRPLWIIFAVTLGGGLFGIPGMLLSVPVMMVVRMICYEILENIEEKKISESREE